MQSGLVAKAQQPDQTESASEQQAHPDHTDSKSGQSQAVITYHQQQQQHRQHSTQAQLSVNLDIAQAGELAADSHQQQQQLPEQLLQQLTQQEQQQHQHDKQQQQQQGHNPQQHDQHQQTLPPGHATQPHTHHTSTLELHNAGSTPCPLHDASLQSASPLPAAATAGNFSSAVYRHYERISPEGHDSHGGGIQEGVAAGKHQTGGGGAEGLQTDEGVWKVLLRAAVCQDQELCQELTEQCRQEESEMASEGWTLAGREQFEELASMADFSLSNWPLAGDHEALLYTSKMPLSPVNVWSTFHWINTQDCFNSSTRAIQWQEKCSCEGSILAALS